MRNQRFAAAGYRPVGAEYTCAAASMAGSSDIRPEFIAKGCSAENSTNAPASWRKRRDAGARHMKMTAAQ
jgi:hypothetical protein